MKLFCFIFSFNVFALAVIPCCENTECVDELTEQAKGHEAERDNCSPFLTCESCTGFTFMNDKVDFQPPFIKDMSKAISIAPAFTSACISTIWQPPKVLSD